MNIELLIPSFEVGERVMCRYSPQEMRCPCCGYIYGTRELPHDEVVEIKGDGNQETWRWECLECAGVYNSNTEGYYIVERSDGSHFGVPYTILEKIEG